MVWRLALIAFVFGLAVINATGVFAQLVSAHVGERGAATSRLEQRTADLEARIDVQAHKVADLNRRLGKIDTTIEEAAKRGRTNAALSAIEGQRKARGGLALAQVIKPNLCGGCRMTVTPQRLQELRAQTALLPCESCGRYLYWLP